MSGMAVIIDKRYMWFCGLAFGVLGTIGVLFGIGNLIV